MVGGCGIKNKNLSLLPVRVVWCEMAGGGGGSEGFRLLGDD